VGPLENVEPSINFGIINSITKLHLVDISTEYSTEINTVCLFAVLGDSNIPSVLCRPHVLHPQVSIEHHSRDHQGICS